MIRTGAHETVYNLVKVAHDPYDVEKLGEIRDKYGADLYKWALAEKLPGMREYYYTIV